MSKIGIIYKLVSRDINIPELYVGSTCSFRARKCGHKKCCNNENDKKYKYNVYQYIRNNGGWDNFDMIQVEEFKHDTSRELHARERYWIEQLKATLNKQIPTRTKAEYDKLYRHNNKDVIAERDKIYRQNNKETIAVKDKQYRQDHLEAIVAREKLYRQNNTEKIAEKNKRYQQKNKEAISEKNKLKYTCECGLTIRVREKSAHNKSAKHLAREGQLSHLFSAIAID